jgi:hypothetical protein
MGQLITDNEKHAGVVPKGSVSVLNALFPVLDIPQFGNVLLG